MYNKTPKGEIVNLRNLGEFTIPRVKSNTQLFFDFEVEIKGNTISFEALSSYGDQEISPPTRIQLYWVPISTVFLRLADFLFWFSFCWNGHVFLKKRRRKEKKLAKYFFIFYFLFFIFYFFFFSFLFFFLFVRFSSFLLFEFFPDPDPLS